MRFNSQDSSTGSSFKDKSIRKESQSTNESPIRRMSLRDTRLEDFQVESNRAPLDGSDVIFECEKLLRS